MKESALNFLWLDEEWVTDSVRSAFETVPYERLTRLEDGSIIVQTTHPELMARILVGLRVEPGMKVLEIGTGSGYNAALLSELVGPEGRVVTIEISEAVSVAARNRLLENGYVEVLCRIGDGWRGCDECAPYDRILAATKPSRIPDHWIRQLKPGGVLVAPIDWPESPTGTMIGYFRKEGETLRLFDEHVGGFVPMTRVDND